MPSGQLHSLIHNLRRVVRAPGSDSLSDGALLERFLATRDEPAFEALVRRHGGMA